METVNEEAKDAFFVSHIHGLLVSGSVPRYPRGA